MPVERAGKFRCLVCLFSLLAIAGMAQITHAAIVITNPSTCPATLPQGQVGLAYSYTFTATGTAAADRWSIISGTQPPGLSLTNNTNLSVNLAGTPTTAGTYSFTIQIKNNARTCACTLTIVPRCVFVGGISNGIISFGNINPSSTSTIYGTVTQQVSFTCVAGTAYTVTVNPSSGWTLVSGSNTIPYTLGVAASGTYSGTAVNLFTPSGGSASSILPANFQNSPAGTYANTSAVSISIGYGSGTLAASVLSGGASGTVMPTCTVWQSPGTLSFGINPSVIGTVSGTIPQDMQIKCTKNGSFSISASSTCGGLSKNYPPTCGGYLIPYTFSFSPGYASGQGFGVAIPMNIGGSVSSTNYQDAPVGNYGDLQTVTISY